MRNWIKTSTALSIVLLTAAISGWPSDAYERAELLRAQEAVWRAWFADHRKALEAYVPPETIVISSGEERWKGQAEVLQSAEQFKADGGKLVSLEFPRTEIQRLGEVAIIYSQYRLETEMKCKRSPSSGRVTEIFVWRDDKWTNPGWHTDAGPCSQKRACQ